MTTKTLSLSLVLLSSAPLVAMDWQPLFEKHKDLIAETPVVLKQYKAFQNDDVPKSTDPRVTIIPVKECGERMVDLRDYTNFFDSPNATRVSMMQDPSYPGEGPRYNSGLPGNSRMRKTLAEKLYKMLENLDTLAPQFEYKEKQVEIKVCDAFRNKQVQAYLFQQRTQKVKKEHPTWTKEHIFEEASRLTAPPKKPFIHPSGAAVDLRLWDTKKEDYIDMGDFGVPWMKKPTTLPIFAENISPEQKKNRLFCVLAAARADLICYPHEFWHFATGDSQAAYWEHDNSADRVAIYDLVKAETLSIKIGQDGKPSVKIVS